ncbi:hypothetical protein B5X24_HaOG207865 [Helicoverpa armigera]|uniref:G-protein coupled receptors family 1 profile domain-containing protein n=1 Tax=Helicoverpa armigera TaxID=29058 RepID=A0A2W1BRP0_HELAM|nr:hypothetical protein B5X24_HaOG207865 [Helicoverpa armigera]
MIPLNPRGGLTPLWCAICACLTALSTATIIGNVAVLVALRRARTAPAHYPLASLATADLFVGLFVLPVAAVRELFVFRIPPVICGFWKTLDVMCCTASILSLCCLGWERWSGITAPLARAKRAKQARLFACLVWPVSLVVALPAVFIGSPTEFEKDESEKGCPDNKNIVYVFYSASLSFYLPAIVMVVLYARILCALSEPRQIRAHRGGKPCPDTGQAGKPSKTALTKCATTEPIRLEMEQTNSGAVSPKACRLDLPGGSGEDPRSPLKQSPAHCCSLSQQQMAMVRAATRTIIRLMGLFLFCWTPFFVALPIDSICDCVWDSIWQWCTWLGYINSALNPLVYAAASPSVRQALQLSLSSGGRTDVQLAPAARNRVEALNKRKWKLSSKWRSHNDGRENVAPDPSRSVLVNKS